MSVDKNKFKTQCEKCKEKIHFESESLQADKPYNYEISYPIKCKKCGYEKHVSLFHKGDGIYSPVK